MAHRFATGATWKGHQIRLLEIAFDYLCNLIELRFRDNLCPIPMETNSIANQGAIGSPRCNFERQWAGLDGLELEVHVRAAWGGRYPVQSIARVFHRGCET
jgi:hypothetical protein